MATSVKHVVAIETRLQDEAARGFERVAAASDQMAREIEQDAKRVERAGNSFNTFWTAVVGGAVGGISAQIGFAARRAIEDYATSFVEMADRAERLQKLLSQTGGMDSRAIQGLGFAAEQTETSFNALVVGSRTLAKQIAQDSSVLHAMGIETRDLRGELRPTWDVLLDMADAFQTSEDGASKLAVATKILRGAGQEWLPILEAGRAGLEKWRRESEMTGNTIEESEIARLARLDTKLDAIRAKWEGFTLNIKLGIATTASGVLGLEENDRNLRAMFATQIAAQRGERLMGNAAVWQEATRRVQEFHQAIKDLEEEESRRRSTKDRVADAIRFAEEQERAAEAAKKRAEELESIRKSFEEMAASQSVLMTVVDEARIGADEIFERFRDGKMTVDELNRALEENWRTIERMRKKAGEPVLPVDLTEVPVPGLQGRDGGDMSAEAFERLGDLRDEVASTTGFIDRAWARVGSNVDVVAARWAEKFVALHGIVGDLIRSMVEEAIAQLGRLAVLDIIGIATGGGGGGFFSWLGSLFGGGGGTAVASSGGGVGGPPRGFPGRPVRRESPSSTQAREAAGGGVARGTSGGTVVYQTNNFNALTVPTVLDAQRSPFGSMFLAEGAEISAGTV